MWKNITMVLVCYRPNNTAETELQKMNPEQQLEFAFLIDCDCILYGSTG